MKNNFSFQKQNACGQLENSLKKHFTRKLFKKALNQFYFAQYW